MKKQRLYVCMSFLTIVCISFSVPLKKQRTQQWLWNTATVLGPLGLMSYAAYQLLKPSSAMIELPRAKEVKAIEQYEKYKNAANRFGYTTVFLSWAMLLSGTPLFVPFIAASYGGALYNGMKGLQLKLQPYMYPISLEQIQINPTEMPY